MPTNTRLQTTLADEEHLTEGQFLLEKRTLNNENSLIHRAATRQSTVSGREIITKSILCLYVLILNYMSQLELAHK
jgi:hypothetical protein